MSKPVKHTKKREPTEWQKTVAHAVSLGIKTVGKKKEDLLAEIAAAENSLPKPADALGEDMNSSLQDASGEDVGPNKPKRFPSRS